MTKLNFADFEDYDKRLRLYLEKNDLKSRFEKCRLDGIKKMVSKFDLSTYTDTNQLAFLMWMLKSDFEEILNDGFLLSKLDLDTFGKKISECTPSLHIGGFHGLTPLGGFSATSKETLPYYDCIKFIGQFTNQQKIYDKCLEILESMPGKLTGPILDPPQVMYLMNYNRHVDTSKNKFRQKIGYMDKHHSFHYSIYQPDPSHESECNRYKKDLQQSYHDIASDDACGVLCLMNSIVHSHYHVVKNLDDIKFRCRIKMSDNVSDAVYQALLNLSDVSDDELLYFETPSDQDKNKALQKIINDKLRFITKGDNNDTDIDDIFMDAYIYVSDDEYETEVVKRDTLIQLYERGIVEANSEFSHNLMREAADYGRLWLVKFLIEKGCPTKNLPKYGACNHLLESRQLGGHIA